MMNRLLTTLLLQAVLIFATACGAQKADKKMTQEHKTLVAYFSATGTTARAAERIAQIAGGDLYRIAPAQPYTAKDLDWHDTRSRSSVEMNDAKCRPEIKGRAANIADYDVVLIGYPIWWDMAPRVINTFIERHNLKGKQIKTFATSGSSAIGHSVAELKRTYPNLRFGEGLLMNSAKDAQIRQWVEK